MSETAKKREAADHARLLAQQQAEDDMRWLMGDPRGRRIVWDLLAEAGIFRSTYTGDAISSAFNEGQRNAGIKLQARVMQHCPEQFVRMLVESMQPGRAHNGGPAA